ncbi:MAG: DUF1385 domain-containing protein [Anaerolineaceae bacterium]|jgi:uncharacterized protein YqhQ
MTKSKEELRLPLYGGQAVLEGVMMRGRNNLAMACRTPDGSIVSFQEKLPSLYQSKWLKVPFLRGIISLWDSMGLGMRMLTQSANVQTGEDEKLEGPGLVLTIMLSLVFGVSLFFLLPAFTASWLERLGQFGHRWGNLLEGLLRLVILIVYLYLVRYIPEIKRTFMYHGAEHKTINAYEAQSELTPEEVQKQTTVHPRCGTSFLLTLVLLSILFFSVLGPLSLPLRLASRILLLPVLAGIAYEYIRWAATASKHSTLMRILIQPNLWLQKLSTIEPTLDMLQVSITAFNIMLAGEEHQDTP